MYIDKYVKWCRFIGETFWLGIVVIVYCSYMAVLQGKKKQLKPTLRTDIIIKNLKQKQKLWVSELTVYENKRW